MAKTLSIVDYIHELKEAGFTDRQAEVQAKRMEQMVIEVKADIKQEFQLADLATRKDIEATKKDIELAKLELQKEIKNLEIKLLTVYGGGVLLILGFLAKGFHWF